MSLEKFLPSFFGASVGASAAAAMSGWLINKTLKEQEARLVSYKQYFDRIDRQFERQAVLLVEEIKKSAPRVTETQVKEVETVHAPPVATADVNPEISPIIETVEGPQLFSQTQIEESYAIGFAHGCVGGSVTSGLLGLLIEIVF
jgi:hypothetical protein